MDTGKGWRVVVRENECAQGDSATCAICGDECEMGALEAWIQNHGPFAVQDHGPVCLACLSNGQEAARLRLVARVEYWAARAEALLGGPSAECFGRCERLAKAEFVRCAEYSTNFAERLAALAEGIKVVPAWPSIDDIAAWQAEIELEASRVIERAGPVAKRACRVAEPMVDEEAIPF